MNAAMRTVEIIHQIRRVGKNEINTVGWELAHHLNAIAVYQSIDEAWVKCLDCAVSCHFSKSPFLPVSEFAQGARREAMRRTRLPRLACAFS
jgi:hypothetical protein